MGKAAALSILGAYRAMDKVPIWLLLNQGAILSA